MTLGEKIKIARKQAGLSQEQLAEKMEVSRSAVAKWEVNNGTPDIDNLKMLSQLLGVTIDYLVGNGENIDKITTEETTGISEDVLSNHEDNLTDDGENADNATITEDVAPPKHTGGKRKKKLLIAAIILIGGYVLGMIGSFMFHPVTTKDMKTYTVTSEISGLCVNINAADITVKQGETFSVESNLKYVTVSDENGLLSIRDEKKLFGNYNNAKLIITIPADVVFENAELKTGAGKLTVDLLSAEVLNCDFGAGEVKINSFSASSMAEIHGGTGKITISGGSINALDFDMGVGQLNLTSLLTGECDLAFGVGESNITLLGSKSDYTLDITKGIGSIRVDGDNISYSSGNGSGQNKVKLKGGIGAVNVKFKEMS